MPAGGDEFSSLSLSEFKKHLAVESLSGAKIESGKGWVLWTPGSSNGSLIFPQNKILAILKKLELESPMVQFWALEQVAGKAYLTTKDQPFSVRLLDKASFELRKICMNNIYAAHDRAEDHLLGPPGRVFRSGHPESSPDIKLYTVEEFPLRNHYLSAQFPTSYLCLPVLNSYKDKQHCVGVVELLLSDISSAFGVFKQIQEATSQHGVKSITFSPNVRRGRTIEDDTKNAMSELQKLFDRLGYDITIQMALAYVSAYKSVENTHSAEMCFEPAMIKSYANKTCGLTEAVFQFHLLQSETGVVGKVLQSQQKWCVFENITHFSIAEEPLSHYFRKGQFGMCIAVCLKCSHVQAYNRCILEFFINVERREYSGKLSSLFGNLNYWLSSSFEVASGQSLQELEITQYRLEMDKPDRNDQEQNTVAVQYDSFKKKLQDVDMNLGGSGSTLKRVQKESTQQLEMACPEADGVVIKAKFNDDFIKFQLHISSGIERLKREVSKRLNLNVECFKLKYLDEDKDLILLAWDEDLHLFSKVMKTHGHKTVCIAGSTSMLERVQQTGPLTSQESAPQLEIVCEEADKMMLIKAKYDDDFIKFELRVSSGIEDLERKVSKRLNLDVQNFIMKYVDEDGDLILLECDEDLHLFSKAMKTLGITTLKILVESLDD